MTKQGCHKVKCLVLKHIPVPRQALLEVNKSLVGIGHGPLVDPGVDFLVSSELQHLPDLIRRADEGAADLDLLQDEAEGHETRHRVFRRADLDELAANIEQAEVAGEGHTRAGDGADNEVERVGVGLLVALLGGGDKLRRPHLKSVLFLAVRSANSHYFVCPERLSPEESEVTETTNADDADTLAGTAAVLLQGRVEGDTTAQHRRCLGRVDAVGDGEHEMTISAPVPRITAVGLLASRPFRVVSSNH